MKETQSAILELLQNYAQCEYPLSLEQIHCMSTVKIEKEALAETLRRMLIQKLIFKHETHHWYTIKGHEIPFRKREERIGSSMNKKEILSKFVKRLRLCPWITSIILTGSLAIDNAKVSDDIDLMIITSPGTMFLCRLYAFVLAKLMGLARKRSVETQADAICVNIWLDRSDLRVPKSKVSVYSAREIVNAQVIVDNHHTFSRFIELNQWIISTLPNWEYHPKSTEYKVQSTKRLLRWLNNLLGKVQLWYMRPHVTHEIVSQTQLWFHPKIRY